MAEWFECKIKYERTLDNGLVKKVNEPYLVDALNFTEAERRIIAEIAPFMSGEFQVSDIKRDSFRRNFSRQATMPPTVGSRPNCLSSHSMKKAARKRKQPTTCSCKPPIYATPSSGWTKA